MRTTAAIVVRIIVLAAYVAGVVWLVLMAISVADVMRRTVGGDPFLAVNEVTEVMQVIPIFLGLAFAEYTGAHVRTGILTSRLKPRAANAVRSFSMLCMVGFVTLMTIALAQTAISATIEGEYRFGVGQVLVWPSRIVAALGSLALLAVCILRLLDLARAIVVLDAEPYIPEPDPEPAGVNP
jgi:TRAP-type C4-dicarboxylate transport system permease small subunit